jgi:hypothetical protein
MTLEQKKIKAELSRVTAAKHEIEYQLELKMDEIRRLEEAVKKQESAESSLQEKLNLIGG